MKVRLKKILFKDEDSGFSIAKADILEGASALNPEYIRFGEVTIKGYFPKSKEIALIVDGIWEKSKYGYSLNVKSFEEVIEMSKEGILIYLSTFVYGISERTAEKLYNHFREDTIRVFEEEPERLLEVRGIGRKRLERMIDSFTANRCYQQIINYLAPLGVTPNKCIRIAKAFGADSMEILLKEPFRLCEIEGFGFKIVDAIARKTTFDLNDPLRIRGGLKYILETAAGGEGHLCLPQLELLAAAYILLNEGDYDKTASQRAIATFAETRQQSVLRPHIKSESVPMQKITEQLRELSFLNELKGDNGFAYLAHKYKEETVIAKLLATRLVESSGVDISEARINSEIQKQERSFAIKLATKQVEAVKLALRNDTCIITGGPGVGKTTVLKVVLRTLEHLMGLSPSDVCLLAPTGRAAQRMAESVGTEYSASTIHSALGIRGEGNGINNFITQRIVVVDEVSMLDSYVMYCLIRAIPSSCKFILIGDPEQLPSVGAGNVLYELLKSKVVPYVKLDVIYRQEGTSPIVINSQLMQKGITNLQWNEDFRFYPVKDTDEFPANDEERGEKIQEECASKICDIFLESVEKYGIDEVQVLCPYRKKGVLAGAYELNKRLQELYNPKSPVKNEVKRGSTVFRIGDKVMQTKNNYDIAWISDSEKGEGIFNGDVGYVTGIDIDNETVNINFGGKRVTLDFTELQTIELAYAISIHKSQGSQYKQVIIPMLTAFYMMLRRNLIYTAITRAKESVVIVGHKKAIAQSIRSNLISKRNTQLAERVVSDLEELNTPKEEVAEQLSIFGGKK